MTDDVFAGFDRRSETHDGVTHDVYQAGSGPAVIVIHEIPGLHPGVVGFARTVIDAGFTAVMPSLFGTPGRPLSGGYVASTVARICVSAEFRMFALGQTSPIIGWLRAVAARAHEECGGPGVGAVGMCFTGGFALGMTVDDRMLAPVLSQPAAPAPISARRRASIDVSDAAQTVATDRAAAIGVRKTGDEHTVA